MLGIIRRYQHALTYAGQHRLQGGNKIAQETRKVVSPSSSVSNTNPVFVPGPAEWAICQQNSARKA